MPAFAVLVLTGIGRLIADQRKDAMNSELWPPELPWWRSMFCSSQPPSDSAMPDQMLFGRGSAICMSLLGRFRRRYLSCMCRSAGEWLDAVSRVETWASGSAARERSAPRSLCSATMVVIFEFSTFNTPNLD